MSSEEGKRLSQAGYKTIKDIAEAPINRFIQEAGVNLKKAAGWINQARRRIGTIKNGQDE
jgi:hypothetical protein